jgi:hypothetical protein
MYLKKLFSLVLLFALWGCQPDKKQDQETNLNLSFKLKEGNIPYNFNQVFKTNQGYRVLVNTLKFYLSHIYLHTQNNDSVLIKDLGLIDFGSAEKQEIKTSPANNTYQGISLFLGVPANLNGTSNPDFDPSIFENSHPLNLINNMYWTWNTGYIFLKIEGKIDTTGIENVPLTNNWFYHNGTDALYTYKKWDIPFNYPEKTNKTIVFTIDLKTFLEGDSNNSIDIKANPFSHTTDNFALAQRVMNNFVGSISISTE